MKKIYLSHPVDLIPSQELTKKICLLKKFFNEMNCDIINSFEKIDCNCSEDKAYEIVRAQIDKIESSDFVVADLTIQNFTYVGCIGEIIYAHLFGKKVYVITGNTGNEQRLWLKFHVTKFFKTFDNLKKFLNKTDKE